MIVSCRENPRVALAAREVRRDVLDRHPTGMIR